jgi:hypothetical protein
MYDRTAVVVQFPVENHRDVLFFVPHRLVAAEKIDDAQPAHAQRDACSARIVRQESVFVGAAVHHRRRHVPHVPFRFSGSGSVREAANSAHALSALLNHE